MLIMFTFLGLLVAELFAEGGVIALTHDDVKSPKFDHHLITSFSIIVFSYNIQFLVFPAFVELKNRTNLRFAKASALSILIETFVYSSTGLVTILTFGMEELKPNFLDNMAKRDGGLSLTIRGIFCLLLILDVPFLFFATKE